MIEKTTEEILNAVKELIAHDHTMESLRTLVKKKLEETWWKGNGGIGFDEMLKDE